ncbi:uncharacterized protein MELLADRAFT_104105 [Melampsora larici-populina 98AG31]|uniref:Uncharacterized protein n=1 Tax=Melampsora larici-populina (strain 98AG31 / pathotype 3-4-7) TaxID=747676 RepID=F4RDK7_MELLP|nr:uncharacterized protein MELLADRAFT_104105 [Melampsora larici-populina 98AG31]EGG09419.1 hypothetical protein MELLADRAFT_104105 [Melampsora larici-populina 98AG31]
MKELHLVDLRIISRRDEGGSSSTLSTQSSFPRSQSSNQQAISPKSILISSGPAQQGPLFSQRTSMSWSSSHSSGSDVSSVQLPFTHWSKGSSRSSSTNSLIKSDKGKAGAWGNIIRWQMEVEKVVQQISRFSMDHCKLDIINNTLCTSNSKNHKAELPLSSLDQAWTC